MTYPIFELKRGEIAAINAFFRKFSVESNQRRLVLGEVWAGY